MVCYSYLFKNFPQFVVLHTVKGFSIATEEVDVFLKFPCFLYDPMDTGNLVSVSSAFSKTMTAAMKLKDTYCLEGKL